MYCTYFFKGEPAELPPNLRTPHLSGTPHQLATPSEPLMTPQQPSEDISELSTECDMQDASSP